MTDIDPRDCADGLADTEQNTIETLRQQLAETRDASRSVADYNLELINQLSESQAEAERYKSAWESSHNQAMQNGQAALESQAREKVLRDAMSLAIYQHSGKGDPHMNHWTAVFYNVLNANANSTALDSAIKQAKREALLEAVEIVKSEGVLFGCKDLQHMAEKFK